MAVYFITGKLGSGKTLVTVGKAKDYLLKNRRVATNLDLNVQHLMPKKSTANITRIPDKPRIEDLELLGTGTDSLDESKFGLIILDECGTWLNTRSWNDKERRHFIDWMLHARKLGWDILFIVQDISIIDKQLKMSLCEHLVVCRRLDRMRIPFISSIVKMTTGLRVTAPKLHVAKVFYGDSETSIVTDRWTYAGRHLYSAYDTRQVFKDDVIINGDDEIDFRASYSVLPRWHIEGRYYQRKPLFQWLTHPMQALLLPIWSIVQIIRWVDGKSARSSGLPSA